MQLRNSLFFAVFAGTIVLFPGCIERDNWWDPYNGCHPIEELPGFRAIIEDSIATVTGTVADRDTTIVQLKTDFLGIVAENDEITRSNTATYLGAKQQMAANAVIDSVNRLVPTDSARSKQPITAQLQNMKLARTIVPEQLSLDTARSRIEAFIATARSYCPKQAVLTKGYIDSTWNFLAVTGQRWSAERESIISYNARILDSNRTVDQINALVHIHDSLVAIYNDSLRFRKIPQYVDPVEIERRIDSLVPGTVIAIGADSVNVANFRIINKRAAGNWMGVEGVPGSKTVVTTTSQNVEVEGSSHIRFVNIIFRGNGKDPAVRITAKSDSIIFSKCEFMGGGTYGVEATNCKNVRFVECIFMGNGNPQDTSRAKAGLRLDACSGTISFVNVLIAGNSGCGIIINQSNANFARGTIAGNTFDGVRFNGMSGTGLFEAKAVLFAKNGGYGIYRNDENVVRDIWADSASGNRFFENGSGAMGGSPGTITANQPFAASDPVFVDPGRGDYRIGPSSTLSGSDIGYLPPR